MEFRKIDITAMAVIVCIMAVFYFAFVKESRARTALYKEQEAVLLQDLRKARSMNIELDRISGEIDRIQENLDSFNRQLPEEQRMYEFLIEIDRLARANNVHLQGIRPGDVETKALYARIPVSISGTAGFKDLYRFLYELENIPRITKMEHLRVRGHPGQDRCDIELDLAVFVGGK